MYIQDYIHTIYFPDHIFRIRTQSHKKKKKKDNDSIWYLQVLEQSSHGFIFTLN